MVFQSGQMRTWDPDTGWELVRIPTGPGYKRFELRHSSERRITFEVELVSVTDIDERGPDGQPFSRKSYRVLNIDGPPSNATKEQRKLIEAALFGYSVAHNGPSGPVEVTYPE